jgi:hypothetical protein
MQRSAATFQQSMLMEVCECKNMNQFGDKFTVLASQCMGSRRALLGDDPDKAYDMLLSRSHGLN